MDEKKLKELQEAVSAIQISNEKIVSHFSTSNKQNLFKQVADQRKEKKQEAAAVKRDKEQTILLDDIRAGISKLGEGLKSGIPKLLGKIIAPIAAAVAIVAAPLIVLVNFFKQLKTEISVLKRLGPGLKKLFKPLTNLFAEEGVLGKAIARVKDFFKGAKGRVSKLFKPLTNLFAEDSVLGKFFKKVGQIWTKVKSAFSKEGILGRLFSKLSNFAKMIFSFVKGAAPMANNITKFAASFGQVLGKLFWPITVIMGIWEVVSGFIEGWQKEGFLEGVSQALQNLAGTFIGSLLDLIKSAVSWVLGKLGFSNAESALDSFSFETLIRDAISGLFNMIKGVVDWAVVKFNDLTSFLAPLWESALGAAADLGTWISDTFIAPLGDWFKKLFENPLGAITDGISAFIGAYISIGAWIWEAGIKPVIEFVSGLFTGALDMFRAGWDTFASSIGFNPNFGDWVWGKTVEPVWTFISGLFGWGADDEKEGFSLSTFISDTIDSVWEWIKDLFSPTKIMGKVGGAVADAGGAVAGFFGNLIGGDDTPKAPMDKKKDKEESGGWFSGWGFGDDEPAKKKPSVAAAATLAAGMAISGGAAAAAAPSTPPAAVKKMAGGNINWAFISEKEGGSQTKGYVPDAKGSKSGVTIATGFDLGARNANDISALPTSLQTKLAPFLGLHGMEAKAALNQKGLEVTSEEATLIDKMSKGEAVKRLKTQWNKTAEEMGGKRFEELTEEQATVAASVAFQYGSLEKTPKFKEMVQSGDWEGAINELDNFGDKYGTRRKSEATLLRSGQSKDMLAAQAGLSDAQSMGQGAGGTTMQISMNQKGGDTVNMGPKNTRMPGSPAGSNTNVFTPTS